MIHTNKGHKRTNQKYAPHPRRDEAREKRMERILFLDGDPEVQTMPKIVAGQGVQDQFRVDLEAEMAAIVSYNEGIANCSEAGEDGSVELLKANLQERHTAYRETQLTFIQQMGLANYLAQTMGE